MEEIPDQSLVESELRKSTPKIKNLSKKSRDCTETCGLVSIINKVSTKKEESLVNKFSNYIKIIRTLAWMLRFVNNCNKKNFKIKGEFMNANEFYAAENVAFQRSQKESFNGPLDPRLKNLMSFVDDKGILRLKAKVYNRNDKFEFRNPIILDSNHPLVQKMVEYTHENLHHAGVNIIINHLRERFWILSCRRLVKSVVKKCTTCRRYNESSAITPPTVLPENRVREAATFEITGIDLAGPLFLKDKQKVWIVIFTCAVYRAVHLELTMSLSTLDFLDTLRRFISRRGRPSFIYSDNGTNFVGAANLLRDINWDKIIKYCSVEKINWIFNPPSAPWWGGWWERLIRIVKDLLRKTLKKACLTYIELSTVLCELEATINSRPLTYLSDDPQEVKAITPSMFLQDVREIGVPDLDCIAKVDFSKRVRYQQRLKTELRERFRIEYLGMLEGKNKINKKAPTPVEIGDIVFIGSDNQKRLEWPLGKVQEIIQGKDGNVRVVKLRTSQGVLSRVLQRLIPLEVKSFCETNYKEEIQNLQKKSKTAKNQVRDRKKNNKDSCQQVIANKSTKESTVQSSPTVEKRTRSGRLVKPSEKFTNSK